MSPSVGELTRWVPRAPAVIKLGADVPLPVPPIEPLPSLPGCRCEKEDGGAWPTEVPPGSRVPWYADPSALFDGIDGMGDTLCDRRLANAPPPPLPL